MQMAHEMRRLRGEHAALKTLARAIGLFIQAVKPPRPRALEAVRTIFRDTLMRHLNCEDWALYPRLQASGVPELARMANEFVEQMGHIADDFEAYDRKWTARRVAADWPAFCRETEAILAVFSTRLEREDRELYPLADGLDLGVDQTLPESCAGCGCFGTTTD